jgi:hypothetical protein
MQTPTQARPADKGRAETVRPETAPGVGRVLSNPLTGRPLPAFLITFPATCQAPAPVALKEHLGQAKNL